MGQAAVSGARARTGAPGAGNGGGAAGAAPDKGAARIGPNAVLQLEAALIEAGGPALAEAVFARAGLAGLLRSRPGAMVDERLPAALFGALFEHFPAAEAGALAHRAGRLTGDYIRANRIPGPARAVLRALPARVGRGLLLRAIVGHAWTFAGSGACTAQDGRPAVISIAANPLAMPGCTWHVGVFESLFHGLVSPDLEVRHTACCRSGAPACRFTLA